MYELQVNKSQQVRGGGVKVKKFKQVHSGHMVTPLWTERRTQLKTLPPHKLRIRVVNTSLWVYDFYCVNTDGTISIQVTSEKPAIHLFTLCVTPGAQDVEQNAKKTGWYNLHNFYLQLQHALRISKESARNEVKPPWI